MKINYNFVTVLGSIGVNQVLAQKVPPKDCNVNSLTKPTHWKAWDCNPEPTITGDVPPKTKCYLECDEGWLPNDNRPFRRCKKNGEWNGHRPLYCIPNFEHWIEQIDKNTADIAANTAGIAKSKGVGIDNAHRISLHDGEIAENYDDIRYNEQYMRENLDMIITNSQNITDVDDNLQEYFEDIMKFDAIKNVDHVKIQWATKLNEGALKLTINGNTGFACDGSKKVDKHTADILCQRAGFWKGAESWTTREPYYLYNKLPIVVGDIFCESWAGQLDSCSSSGWGNLREPACNSYDDVLFLKCYPNEGP